MEIKYRVATTDDSKKLESLSSASASEQLERYSRNKKGLFDVQEYTRNGGGFWIAESNDKIIGMVGVRLVERGKMKVKALRVHPNYQRQGIAKKLMNVLIDYCQKHSAKEIVLGVQKNSLPAIALYESLGFTKYEERWFEPANLVYYYKMELNN